MKYFDWDSSGLGNKSDSKYVRVRVNTKSKCTQDHDKTKTIKIWSRVLNTALLNFPFPALVTERFTKGFSMFFHLIVWKRLGELNLEKEKILAIETRFQLDEQVWFPDYE